MVCFISDYNSGDCYIFFLKLLVLRFHLLIQFLDLLIIGVLHGLVLFSERRLVGFLVLFHSLVLSRESLIEVFLDVLCLIKLLLDVLMLSLVLIPLLSDLH